jgi:hypothetical protein
VRDLTTYLKMTRSQLTAKLAIVTLELMHAWDQIGFLRSEELKIKSETWLALEPDISTAAKDRAAAHAASKYTIELAQAEAERNVLTEERNFIQGLLTSGK